MDVFQVLKKLISYDTRTNENQPGLQIMELFTNEIEPVLKEHGFEVHYFESNGHHSLFAEKHGKDPIILYSGHVDTVPWDDRWVTDPQQMIEDEEFDQVVLKGRGVSDMKSGIAALICAIPEMAKSEATVYLALTGDEEIGGEDGTKVIVEYLRKENKLPHYVITADASGMEIITRRRNVFDLIMTIDKQPMTIKGKVGTSKFQTKITSSQTSHAAYYKKAIDTHCVKEACDFILKNGYLPISISGSFVKVNVVPHEIDIKYVIPGENGPEISYDQGLLYLMKFIKNIMEIDFETQAFSEYGINSTVNVIDELPDKWRLQIDIRAMLDHQAFALDQAIEKIKNETPGNINIEIQKSIGFIATSDDSPLVKATTKILADLNYNSKSAERGGATDGRFFAYYKIPTVDIGAIGWNVHGPNETATKKSIEDLVKFFEIATQKIYEMYN